MATRKKILEYLNKNGLEFYGMLQRKKITISKLNEVVNNCDIETLEKWYHLNCKDDYSYYAKRYTKLDCLDELLDYDKNKYTHLRSIRDIVQMDDIVNGIIDEKTYKEAISFYYLRMLLKKLYEYNSKLEIDYNEILRETKINFFNKLIKNTDNYYIGVITK